MDKPYTIRMSILDEQGEEKVVAIVNSKIIEDASVVHNIDGVSLLYNQLLEEYKKYE